MVFSTESFKSIVKRLKSYTVSRQSKDKLLHPIQSMYTNSSGVQGKTASHLSTPDFVCGHCKKPGHRAANCWLRRKKGLETRTHESGATKTHSSHLTVAQTSNNKSISESKQIRDFTYVCTPNGRRFHCDDLKFEDANDYNHFCCF